MNTSRIMRQVKGSDCEFLFIISIKKANIWVLTCREIMEELVQKNVEKQKRLGSIKL